MPPAFRSPNAHQFKRALPWLGISLDRATLCHVFLSGAPQPSGMLQSTSGRKNELSSLRGSSLSAEASSDPSDALMATCRVPTATLHGWSLYSPIGLFICSYQQTPYRA